MDVKMSSSWERRAAPRRAAGQLDLDPSRIGRRSPVNVAPDHVRVRSSACRIIPDGVEGRGVEDEPDELSQCSILRRCRSIVVHTHSITRALPCPAAV